MKTVLVTGGTQRLGKAIADGLRAAGWRVITHSHRPDAGADVVADLSEPLGPARLYAQTLQLLNGEPPDALVNNAALFDDDPARLQAVNFTAPQKLTILMAGRETGRGTVVNILDSRVLGDRPLVTDGFSGDRPHQNASAAGDRPRENFYFKTKYNLLLETTRQAAMFSATLRVNGVAPGPVLPSVSVHEKAGETPLGRPIPKQVADAVVFLLSAEATSGCVIPVDGGQALVEMPIDGGQALIEMPIDGGQAPVEMLSDARRPRACGGMTP